MKNAFKGALLGAIDAVLIVAAIRGLGGRLRLDEMVLLVMIAGVVATPVGAALGILGGRLRENRILVLEIIALSLIPVCGIAVLDIIGARNVRIDDGFIELVMLAAAPTALGLLVLERWTRPHREVARAIALRAA